MKYIKLFENFEDYDPYELMIIPPNKKGEMLVEEIQKPEPNLNLISDLITLGADLDWQEGDGWTALHWCAYKNRPEIARMLIDAGADKTIPNNDGELPYELADTQELKEL